MRQEPFYFTDITDYATDQKLEYALLRKEILQSIPPHRHSFLEISLVLDGAGTETINGKSHELMPGAFSLLLPYHVHKLTVDPGQRLVLYNLALSLDAVFSGGAKDFGLREMLFSVNAPPAPHLQLAGEQFPTFTRYFEEMAEECRSAQKWSDFLIKAKLVEILATYDRLSGTVAPVPERADTDRDGVFWEIVQYIHQNYQENLTLDSLTRQFHLQNYQISRLFKHKTGENYSRYLSQLRVKHACSLLISTGMTVLEVALEAGFESYMTFSRTFRTITGMSALQYRKSREV